MDIALQTSGTVYDIAVANNDLVSDSGLRTAVIISLFTDSRVTAEELPALETDKKGWWGDSFPDVVGDQIGSKLWTLKRSKETENTRKLAQDYCTEALQWMIDDGLAASVDVVCAWNSPGFLAIQVSVNRPRGNIIYKFKAPWTAEGNRGNT